MIKYNKKPLRVLLLTRYFPPEIGTAATLFYELAQGLTARGHRVTVVTGFPWYNLDKVPKKYKKGFCVREHSGEIGIIRIRLDVPGPAKFRLFVGHLFSPLSMLIGGLLTPKVDICYGYSPPILVGIVGWLLGKLKGYPFVLGVQDLHPQAYIDQGILKNPLLIRMLQTLEVLAYRAADGLTVHSDGNLKYVSRKVSSSKYDNLDVLPNWVDTEKLSPRSKKNEFSSSHSLGGSFVVGYAGTLGLSQGGSIIIDTAEILKNIDDIVFVVVGDGIDKINLVNKARSLGLGNIRFLGMQPAERYPEVVASFNLGLVTLNERVATPVVPSKIISLMAAGRAIVASVPLESGKLIRLANCGITTNPGDEKALSSAIRELHNDPDKLKQYANNGRRYVEENLSIGKATTSLENIFLKHLHQ